MRCQYPSVQHLSTTMKTSVSQADTSYFRHLILKITKLSSFTGYVRRIFFFDWDTDKSFYKDLNSSDISSAHELTEYIPLPNHEKIRDICYFNGVIYWIIGGSSVGIGKMTDYDQTNPSFQFQEISQYDLRRMYIADIETWLLLVLSFLWQRK